MTSLLFGDIFRYNEKEYIFLAKTEEVLYAAQILNPEISGRIDKVYQSKIYNGKLTKVLEGNILYCYVILQTEEFKDRMAHFATTGKDGFSPLLEKLPLQLNKEDLKAIKAEIVEKNAIPLALKELVKSIPV